MVKENLTKSPHVGVRWQAQMEEHLDDVRRFSYEALLPGVDSVGDE